MKVGDLSGCSHSGSFEHNALSSTVTGIHHRTSGCVVESEAVPHPAGNLVVETGLIVGRTIPAACPNRRVLSLYSSL